MNKLIAVFVLSVAPTLGFASGGHVHLEAANVDLEDQASLQSGAKYFMSYCMGCHSLKYMRYNRMAEDLGIDETALRQNLIFGDAKPGDLMTNAMRPEDGEKWFGVAVPDLTLVTRWRGSDWVYTYLKSFYTDPTRPYGVNNLVFPAVGMPHVLAGLQGVQEPVLAEHEGEGGGAPVVTGVNLTQPGSLSPEQYDAMARDITAFLTYAGEPIQLERKRLGIYVLLFLGVLFILAYALKKEFWKDVH
jgi:ubiquinol-cytochrome c reductase cytochrome c1 subunit